jgi:ketosteroid isomerase-like protein
VTPTLTLTITQLSDIYAIERLLSDYAVALNGRDWDHYRRLFRDDAVIDYTTAGGIRGSVAEVSAWVADAFKAFPVSQLYITDKRIQLQGLTATCESSFFEIALRQAESGEQESLFVGGTYVDEVTKGADGWLFQRRTEKLGWTHGAFPEELK